jgi:hypothetical protein
MREAPLCLIAFRTASCSTRNRARSRGAGRQASRRPGTGTPHRNRTIPPGRIRPAASCVRYCTGEWEKFAVWTQLLALIRPK